MNVALGVAAELGAHPTSGVGVVGIVNARLEEKNR